LKPVKSKKVWYPSGHAIYSKQIHWILKSLSDSTTTLLIESLMIITTRRVNQRILIIYDGFCGNNMARSACSAHWMFLGGIEISLEMLQMKHQSSCP
jgi:hypothetical protein